MDTPSKLPSPPLPGPLEPGTTLQNRYEVERLIGGGGMGMVYLARDRRLANRPCAIKEMVDHFIDPQQRIEANKYFASEADTLAQLKHSAIPAVTDRFDDRNRHYLVMEYVEGRNLEEEIAARGGPLPEGLVIDIARQLCDVLAHLHGLSPPIIYRDMKPSNVMLTPKGRVVLIDFGIARLFKAARKGTMIGTLGFAPPEQYQGSVDPRSDLYSLGATLHYVLTGRDPEQFPPFSFPKVRQLCPGASSNLAGAIDAALSYDAAGRPATVQQFRDMMLYGQGLPDPNARAVDSSGGTGSLAMPDEFPAELPETGAPIGLRRPPSPVRRAIVAAALLIVLGSAAFAGTLVYSSPRLQAELGIKPLIDQLPWKHEELLAKALEHPLDFQQMTLALSTREGDALGPPQAVFKDSDLASAHYLKWTASFKNALAGLEGRGESVQARFFDPSGQKVSTSDASQFVGPAQKTADFSGVALIPSLGSKPSGSYKVALYSGDSLLAQEAFTVQHDVSVNAGAEAGAAAAAEAAAEAAAKRKSEEDARRLAMLDARLSKPLQLRRIDFVNTTKTGTVLSGPAASFNVSKVLFIGWEAAFENRLYQLAPNQYRVDAVYIAPDGNTLGGVNDFESVSPNQKTAMFSGRVGNSGGGAFPPGTYTVNFYLNGQYFAKKKFRVIASTGSTYTPASTAGAGGAASGAPAIAGPMVASGSIRGLPGSGSAAMDLRLRPQANGWLRGEIVIHQAGFDAAAIDGFIRGDHVAFQVAYGTETYSFDGRRSAGAIGGTFESQPSGRRGHWSARIN
ncbi:MAG: serine/threonine protein kinase [Candidatus Binataceae bacterium]